MSVPCLSKEPPGWDTNNEHLVRIFCAALSGITANPAFFGPIFQQSPEAAVEFANQCVIAQLRASATEAPF